MQRLQWLDGVRQDLALTLRGLRRTPGFTAAVMITLGLGLGANVAIFSLADRLFLRPPAGVVDPGGVRRLYVRSNWTVGSVTTIRPSFEYRELDVLAASYAAQAPLAAYTPADSVRLGRGDGAPMVRVSYATASLFPLLGVRPFLGRGFTAADDRMGAGAAAAIVSHALWRRELGGDPRILGREIEIAHRTYTVIGVAPEGFGGPDLDTPDLWVPLATFPAPAVGGRPWYSVFRSGFHLHVLARPRASVSDAWLSTVGTTALRRAQLAEVSRGADTSATLLVGPLLESLGPSITPAPEVAIATRLSGVVVIVLLIACANVANLLLARAVQRRREIAVRLALGVSRRRLVALLLTESLVLSCLGGLVAVVVGTWGGAALRATLMPATHWNGGVFDWRVMAFTLVAALVAGTAAGLVPALQASRTDLAGVLSAGVRAGGAHRSRLRTTLIVAQAALSVILLAGAGLFVRSLGNVRAIELGYDVDRLVFATVAFLDPKTLVVGRGTDDQRVLVADGLRQAAVRLAGMREVEGTALASSPPMRGFSMVPLFLPGGATPPLIGEREPALVAVSPEYFATTGVRLVRGRLPTAADDAGAPPVMVVNETLAKAWWPGEDALGKCVSIRVPTSPCVSIVGITRDTHIRTIIEEPVGQIFIPLAQGFPGSSLALPGHLVIRTAPRHAAAVAEAARRELRRIFPTAEPPRVTSLAITLAPQFRPWQLGAVLFSAFGLLALVVAAIGVYSVTAHAVGQRLHEMGVRVALGARPWHVLRLVVSGGTMVVIAGVAIGIGMSLAGARLVESMVYGVSARDPLVLAVVAAILVVAALVASAIPAWRATRVDPVEILRAE